MAAANGSRKRGLCYNSTMKKPRVNKRYIMEEVESEMVFFDTEKSVLITLNPSATHMFKLIKRGKTKEEVAKSTVKIYATTEKQALKDCERLINNLKKREIIQ